MNYSGGVYISQVIASGERNAMRKWLMELETDSMEGFTKEDKQQLITDDFSDEDPVPIEGCKNVWCFGARTAKE
ncbi:hypothetical protein V9K67_07555 [Paraflavisolibacter sp. H34]